MSQPQNPAPGPAYPGGAPGHQPPWPQQPGTGGQTPPPKKGKTGRILGFGCLGLIVLAVIIVVASCAMMAGATTSTPDSGSAAGNKAGGGKKATKAAGIGDPVTSGDFRVKVTKVQPGVHRVGDDILGKSAQGQFVLVKMTIENVGSSAQYFEGSDVKLKDTKGKEYSADDEAAIDMGDSNAIFEQINPGNTSKGTVVFDVPTSVKPKTLTFQGGLFDDTIVVDIG